MNTLPKWRMALSLCLAALACVFVGPAAALRSTPIPPEREIMVMVPHPAEHFRPSSSYSGSYGDELARSARTRLATRIARQHGLTLVDNYPMPMIGVDCFIMAVPPGRSRDAAIAEVSRDARVAWSQPVTLFQTQSAPTSHNDPLFAAQPAARQWKLADLHRTSTGRGVKIAVIDSAIDVRHPDLAGQVVVRRNFVTGSTSTGERHGTEVAGIIAAKADNGIGIVGVAPGARLLGLRACQQNGATTTCDGFSLAKALYFAVEQKADIINLSLGGPDDRLLRELLKLGLSRGDSVIAAFDRSRPNGGFPASMPGVVAVSDRALAGSPRSVYIAPGKDIPTTLPGGRWYLVNGSSFAAAHVSGLVALVGARRASAMLVSDRSGAAARTASARLRS